MKAPYICLIFAGTYRLCVSTAMRQKCETGVNAFEEQNSCTIVSRFAIDEVSVCNMMAYFVKLLGSC